MGFAWLKISLRSLVKYKTYTLINIVGLSLGLSFALMVFIYAWDEYSYDRHHSKSERIYRLVEVINTNGVGEESASCPFPVAQAFQTDFQGMVEQVTRVFNFQSPQHFIDVDNKIFKEQKAFFADSNFFEVFDFQFLSGTAKDALANPKSVVLSKTTAQKYFGDTNPIGKAIKFNKFFDLTVTAVVEDVPSQSHFKPELIVSLSTIREIFSTKNYPGTWVWNPCWTYIVVKKGLKAEDIEKSLPDFVNKYFYDAKNTNIKLYLQALSDIHLKSALDYEIEPNGNEKYVFILESIALFILLIACINFVNLSTAIATGRAREIGIKKVHGATRFVLWKQFLAETYVITLLAIFLAIDICIGIFPYFNEFTGKSFEPSVFLSFPIVARVGLLWAVIGLLSGLYPALVLSSIKPVKTMNGFVIKGSPGALGRKILVVSQFAISTFLIISSILVYKQLIFLQNADMGLDKQNVLILNVDNTPVVDKYNTFRQELLQEPWVVNVTASDDIPGVGHNTWDFNHEGVQPDQWVYYPSLAVRHGFLDTYGIKIVEGRDFSELNKTDSIDAILVNEAMVKFLGWKSNAEALGKPLRTKFGNEKIVGVFKNFNATSLHGGITPFTLDIKERPWDIRAMTRFLAIKYKHSNREEVLAMVKQKWENYCPGFDFDTVFYADKLEQLYAKEKIFSRLSLGLAILIICISLVGLFGLTSYLTLERTREIGIRKVLGDHSIRIAMKFTFQFIGLVALSNLIAWPFAYLMMQQWFTNFSVHIGFDYSAYLFGILFTLVPAFLVSAIRVLMVASQNPAQTLRYD